MYDGASSVDRHLLSAPIVLICVSAHKLFDRGAWHTRWVMHGIRKVTAEILNGCENEGEVRTRRCRR